jgi:hypothetical protein
MCDVDAIGGVPVVLKELLSAGFLHGNVMTVEGMTLAELLSAVPSLDQLPKQDVIYSCATPFAAPNNHISVLHGNIACDSALLKLSGKVVRILPPVYYYNIFARLSRCSRGQRGCLIARRTLSMLSWRAGLKKATSPGS